MSGTSRQKPPGWVTVLRDLVSLVCAWLIVFKQAGIVFDAPAELSEPLLWLAGAMIGVPGVGQVLALRFGGGGSGGGRGGGGPPPVRPVSRRSGSASSARLRGGGGGDDT